MNNKWIRLVAMTTFHFALQMCNNQESQSQKADKQKPSKTIKSMVDSAQSVPDTWESLIKEQNLVESDDLEPAAFISFKNLDKSLSYCVGNYIGNRKLITAAHCLQGITDSASCKKNILIEWTLKNPITEGNIPLSKKYIRCKSFQVHPQSGSSSDKVDVGVILLDSKGFLPKRKYEMDHLENLDQNLNNHGNNISKNDVLIGKSYIENEIPRFKKVSGKIFNVTNTQFSSQIYNEKGMSGSAVEYLTNDGLGKRIMIGVHVSGTPNTSFSLSIKNSAFLSWANSVTLDKE